MTSFFASLIDQFFFSCKPHDKRLTEFMTVANKNFTGFEAESEHAEYLIISFENASASFQARLVPARVVWLDQTRRYRRTVLERCD